MADLVTCSVCGAPNQEVGKFCEQCGSKVAAAPSAEPASSTPDVVTLTPPEGFASTNATPSPSDSPLADNNDLSLDGPLPTLVQTDTEPDAAPAAPVSTSSSDPYASLRFIRLENGTQNPAHSFPITVGHSVLIGRSDPANGVFPDVDVTMWSQRVQTPDGPLYTIHRKQCTIERDSDGKVWINDVPEYVGDTMVSPSGSGQFRTIPALAAERERNADGAIRLEVGDRILMGQAEGMLIFVLVEE